MVLVLAVGTVVEAVVDHVHRDVGAVRAVEPVVRHAVRLGAVLATTHPVLWLVLAVGAILPTVVDPLERDLDLGAVVVADEGVPSFVDTQVAAEVDEQLSPIDLAVVGGVGCVEVVNQAVQEPGRVIFYHIGLAIDGVGDSVVVQVVVQRVTDPVVVHVDRYVAGVEVVRPTEPLYVVAPSVAVVVPVLVPAAGIAVHVVDSVAVHVEPAGNDPVGCAVAVGVLGDAGVVRIHVVVVHHAVIVVVGVVVDPSLRYRQGDVVYPDGVRVAADAEVLVVHPLECVVPSSEGP